MSTPSLALPSPQSDPIPNPLLVLPILAPSPQSDLIPASSPTLPSPISSTQSDSLFDTSLSHSQPSPINVSNLAAPTPPLPDLPTTIPHVPSVVQVPSTVNSHPMMTRSKYGIYKPKALLAKTNSDKLAKPNKLAKLAKSTSIPKPDYTLTGTSFLQGCNSISTMV
ncbi:proline-rich receptor-like protein kinase PERK10 [Quercus lobata]|uniref:proline-rich receptor-like protein kinase PERK10 n=1 Tax=Quercus lobata TaxID=97700 RepID=UPI001245CDFE|nr:proline-rich receptor-like protein kinase PERK10 [Quercus lobata]